MSTAAEAPEAPAIAVVEIEVDRIRKSPTNPRKTFAQRDLDELAQSIRQRGVLQPITVRTVDSSVALFEIVVGERRWRAALTIGLAFIPAFIRDDLDDEAVEEIQQIENLQRVDLHPLEEADGYGALFKRGTLDVDAIAQRIGKDRQYVYDRMGLRHLINEARELFLAGAFTVEHATLLARLTDHDQRRAIGDIGDDDYRGVCGLFQADHGEHALDLGDDFKAQPRKAVSVSEFQKWINDHVRLRPEQDDLPNLFPEAAVALASAAEADLKVVKISRDHQLKPSARQEGERTYTRPSWKRADGEVDHSDFTARGKPSKPCEHAVLGVVIAGPGRGDAFPVCIAKKKCRVHWADEIKASTNGAKKGAQQQTVDRAAEQRKREEEQQRQEAERARWKKAQPALLTALAAKVGGMDANDVVDIVLEAARVDGRTPKQMKRGKGIEDAVRYGAFAVLAAEVRDEWFAPQRGPAAFKRVDLDAKAIVDEAAPLPKPKAAKKVPAKKAAKKRKRGGGR